jgi:hypothetical protein
MVILMDWEMLLAFAWLYILFIGTLAHSFKSQKILMDHDKRILKLTSINQTNLKELKNNIDWFD